MSSQNSIINFHGRWMILVKGDGSIYRPRVGEMDGQDDEMVREGQDALKRENMDCVCLAPMGR